MRNTNKKGFTIVELVIVVAVIAILAAVLIPTFSSIIKKANQSADQQAVTNMNKLLATEAKADDVDGVIEILIKNNYAGDLTTYFKGYKLAWLPSENVIVLVEGEAVVYPKANVGATGYEIINPMATDGEALAAGLEAGKTVYVGDNVTVADGLYLESAGTYEVNLAGNTLNSNSYVGSWVDGGKLVVSNGVIDATASGEKISVYADEGGYVELNNVQVYSAATANPLQCYGGTMVLNNVTTAQHGVANTSWYNSAVMVVNNIAKNSETGKYEIYGVNADLTVNGGMYSGDKAIMICAPGGNVTINGGTFVGTNNVIQGDFVRKNYGNSESYESVITINGGTFTGNIKVSADTELVINGGTFTVNPTQWVADGHTVVDNGNGTWTVK